MPVTITTTKEERAAKLVKDLRETGLVISHVQVTREPDYIDRTSLLGGREIEPMIGLMRTRATLEIQTINEDGYEFLYYLAHQHSFR